MTRWKISFYIPSCIMSSVGESSVPMEGFINNYNHGKLCYAAIFMEYISRIIHQPIIPAVCERLSNKLHVRGLNRLHIRNRPGIDQSQYRWFTVQGGLLDYLN
jgi:hypothetical protein